MDSHRHFRKSHVILQILEKAWCPVENAQDRGHDMGNNQSSTLLVDGCHGSAFDFLPGMLEPDRDGHKSYSTEGSLSSKMRRYSPNDLLEHAGSGCDVDSLCGIALWDKGNLGGKILAFWKSSWLIILG